jgi:hypothetical protein
LLPPIHTARPLLIRSLLSPFLREPTRCQIPLPNLLRARIHLYVYTWCRSSRFFVLRPLRTVSFLSTFAVLSPHRLSCSSATLCWSLKLSLRYLITSTCTILGSASASSGKRYLAQERLTSSPGLDHSTTTMNMAFGYPLIIRLAIHLFLPSWGCRHLDGYTSCVLFSRELSILFIRW